MTGWASITLYVKESGCSGLAKRMAKKHIEVQGGVVQRRGGGISSVWNEEMFQSSIRETDLDLVETVLCCFAVGHIAVMGR